MHINNDLREEEVKLIIEKTFFPNYQIKILGNIDFAVTKDLDKYKGRQQELFSRGDVEAPVQSFLWAEAKKGRKKDIYESFVQLILTIGKEKTYEEYLPPIFLGAFDAEKIAFIPYNIVASVFTQNDFNWKVAPSNHKSKEFQLLFELVKTTLTQNSFIFYYDGDESRIKEFISKNFILGKHEIQQGIVTKNNFTTVYYRWLRDVLPSIRVPTPWEKLKRMGIIEADFYLADLLSDKNLSLKDSLFVLLKHDHYEFGRRIDEFGFEAISQAGFIDEQKAHRQFWNLYKRPPKKEYWDYIVNRRDLLVPQDVRERKGSFFTPAQWVEKSQLYIEKALGENWQDEYVIWDCCAGTGNLLAGLTNKYKIWASTIDKADVDVMKDRIKNGANLLESHVFQFDFLNDSFDKLPPPLKAIIDSPLKRKNLLIYINPPYAEAATTKTVAGKGKNKTNVAVQTKVYEDYSSSIGLAARELFAQFLIRIKKELNGVRIGCFSKLKILQAPLFKSFRHSFNSQLDNLFLMPANTFDNVKGNFPIAFQMWNTQQPFAMESEIHADVFNADEVELSPKRILIVDDFKSINDWIIKTRKRANEHVIGFLSAKGADFQNQNFVFFINRKDQLPHPRGTLITNKNIREICIYIAARKTVEKTWLNDRDQFFEPSNSWSQDGEFQADCLIYTLFSNCNNIKSSEGINYWIPFTESEMNAADVTDSHFMSDLLAEKRTEFDNESENDLIKTPEKSYCNLIYSEQALNVLNKGRALYQYYHSFSEANPNASFYDIKEFFKGRNEDGSLNHESEDSHYNQLIEDLRIAHSALAKKIQPKIYEYGFLIR